MLLLVMKNTPTIKVSFSTTSSKSYKRLAFSIKAIKAKMAKGAKLVPIYGSSGKFFTLDENTKQGTKVWFFRDETQVPLLEELYANQ